MSTEHDSTKDIKRFPAGNPDMIRMHGGPPSQVRVARGGCYTLPYLTSSQARSRRRQATADGRRDSGAEPGHGVTMGVTLQQLYTLSNRITVDVRWRESSGSVTLTLSRNS